jgi:hypothetical protein
VVTCIEIMEERNGYTTHDRFGSLGLKTTSVGPDFRGPGQGLYRRPFIIIIITLRYSVYIYCQ